MDSKPLAGRLAGRRALITGASRGIGRAIALRFAAKAPRCSWRPRHARQAAGDRRQAGPWRRRQAHVHVVDVADRAAVQAMVDTAMAAMGGIDVLVNNAGVYHAARLVDTEPEDFDRVMQVNVYGAFHVLQRAAPPAGAARGQGGEHRVHRRQVGVDEPERLQRQQTRAGGLTRCAALEMGRFNVNVNAICPGFVQTDMLGEFEAHARILGVPFETVLDNGRNRVPLKRFLQPDEVAALAVYLASADSDGMTGQSLLIDGGMVMV
jgi:meso-butanediol dehydrogenase/(S,S)-butanediol dehydrogenase/diacetyl reductase